MTALVPVVASVPDALLRCSRASIVIGLIDLPAAPHDSMFSPLVQSRIAFAMAFLLFCASPAWCCCAARQSPPAPASSTSSDTVDPHACCRPDPAQCSQPPLPVTQDDHSSESDCPCGGHQRAQNTTLALHPAAEVQPLHLDRSPLVSAASLLHAAVLTHSADLALIKSRLNPWARHGSGMTPSWTGTLRAQSVLWLI